jgi:hypothetical protein
MIHIDSRLKGQAKMDTIAHELCHAAVGEHIAEESILEAGRIIGSVFHRILKYREPTHAEQAKPVRHR